MTDALDRARDAFVRREWGEAFAQLSAADAASPLPLDGLELLALAANLVGRPDFSDDVSARAHREHLQLGNPTRAARCAFYLGFELLGRGESARSGGWLARGQRLLDDNDPHCVENGYLLLPAAMLRVFADDWAGAHRIFERAAEIADQFGDTDLMSWAQMGRGRALIRLGSIAEGVAVLDEVMVAVTSDEVSPWVAGYVYCGVIEGCQEVFDHRRAREWTPALCDWCNSQPDLVPYRGQCLVHRAEIMQVRGEWSEAMAEARRACDRLSQPIVHPALGAANY